MWTSCHGQSVTWYYVVYLLHIIGSYNLYFVFNRLNLSKGLYFWDQLDMKPWRKYMKEGLSTNRLLFQMFFEFFICLRWFMYITKKHQKLKLVWKIWNQMEIVTPCKNFTDSQCTLLILLFDYGSIRQVSGTKMAPKRCPMGWWKGQSTVEFIKMKGPGGKGHCRDVDMPAQRDYTDW